MQRNEIPLFLHPIHMQFLEYGNVPEKNPTQNVERLLSKNLLYHCRKNARTVEEIAAALGMYPEYIIDELQILTDEDGTGYPFVVKTPDGKYRANILLVSVEELDKWEQDIGKDVWKIADDMKRFVEKQIESLTEKQRKENDIENLSIMQPEENHIKSLSEMYSEEINIDSIRRKVYCLLVNELQHQILEMLAKQLFFQDIEKSTKEYTCIGIISDEDFSVSEKMNHLQEKCRVKQQENQQKKSHEKSHKQWQENQQKEPQERCRKEQPKQPKEQQKKYSEKHQQEQQPSKATSCDLLSQLTEQFLAEQQSACEKLVRLLAVRLKHIIPKHLLTDYEAAAKLFLGWL